MENKMNWECNSCGFSDYNNTLSEEDMHSGLIQCSNCGEDEFHLVPINMEDYKYETKYEGMRFLVPYSEMSSWYEHIKGLSLVIKDAGHSEIAFMDAFRKYQIN